MGKGKEIKEGWESHIPPEVRKQDVELVIREFFPKSRFGKRSSHEFVIYSELAKEVYERVKQEYGAQNAQELVSPFNYEGKKTVPIVSGRKVKGEYVRDILKLIDKEEKFPEYLENLGKLKKGG